MGTLMDAVELLAAGDWQAAHAIVQQDGSTHGAWAHGIVHLMEGDRGNAGYWYGRAKRELPAEGAGPPGGAIRSEIAALRTALGASPRSR